MRQINSSDPQHNQFIDLIPRFRNGDATIEDWKLLLTRIPSKKNLEPFKDAPRLFPENLPCNKYNIEKLNQLNQPITCLNAKNEPNNLCKFDSDNFSGLENIIYLAVDAKITITSNIWKRVGILNVANGTIKAILYPIKKDYKTLPHTIIVHIPIYTEPQFTQNQLEQTGFQLILLHIIIQAHGHRTQMPMKLAYAMTVHKSQGKTLTLGAIDFTNI